MSVFPSVRFFYFYASDIEAMRAFYTDLIGLNEVFFQVGPEGGLGYACDALQFTIFAAPELKPDLSDTWAMQPGWQGGTNKSMSWSIEATEETFAEIVKRVKKSDVNALYAVPQWVGYWSFPVKDPMGNTVEVTWPEENKDENPIW